jgi:hypothetical protein
MGMVKGFTLQDGQQAYGCHEKKGRAIFLKHCEGFALAFDVNPVGSMIELVDMLVEIRRQREFRAEIEQRRVG